MTRIEPDVAKDVTIERKRNSRTVQGEVNAVLRDHYASKWDGANDAITPTQEDAMIAKALATRAIKHGRPVLVCANPNATGKFAP